MDTKDNSIPRWASTNTKVINMTKGFKRLGADPDSPGTGVLKMNPKETTDLDNPDVDSAVERLGKVFDLTLPFDVEKRIDKKGNAYVCLVPKGAEPELPDGETEAKSSDENMGLTSTEKPKSKKATPKKERKADPLAANSVVVGLEEEGDGVANSD